jgi:tetratricopeptide (TPR) repeat protein
MRRLWVYLALIAVAVSLLFLLRHRKRQFIDAQIQLIQSDDPDRATQARMTLERVGRAATQYVCPLLEHENDEIRVRAALTLANIGDHRAADSLMAAAKRGDFPAADALEQMKHARAAEARAWAYCRLADSPLEELRRHWPIGGEPPTTSWVRAFKPKQPFSHSRPVVAHWPWDFAESDTIARRIVYRTLEARDWHRRARLQFPLPEAFAGEARARMRMNDYRMAAMAYRNALDAGTIDKTLGAEWEEAQRLRRLQADVGRPPPDGGHVRQILEHPSWGDGDGACRIATIRGGPYGSSFSHGPPRMLVFQGQNETFEPVGDVVPIYTRDEVAAVDAPRWYLGAATLGPGEAAAVAVLRKVSRHSSSPGSHDVAAYRLTPGGLQQILRAPSDDLPWVGDLDQDGDMEIVTWRHMTAATGLRRPVPWPIVHTMVNGGYEIRTLEFPQLLDDMVALAVQHEERKPLDPTVPDYLSQAYERLGRMQLAIAACERAERKYLQYSEAAREDGLDNLVGHYRMAAQRIRQRLLRLQAEGNGD